MEQKETIILLSVTCYTCGTVFGINKKMKQNLLENGKLFYCPNGHGQQYTNRKTLEQQIVKKDAEIKDLSNRIGLVKDKAIDSFCDYRFLNYLRMGDIYTIGDALELGETGLLQIYEIGHKCIRQINNNLSLNNIRLKTE